MVRVWEPFLTEVDKAHVARLPKKRVGFGQRAGLLMIDNYRKAIGDEPQPLLDAIDMWPSSTGLAGWEALKHIGHLLTVARSAGLPIVHSTGLTTEESGIAPRTSLRGTSESLQDSDESSAAYDRHARRYDFVEQAAPLRGEVVIRKTAPSAFFGTPLISHLHSLNIDTLIVGGESTSGCVRASVVDAASYRFRVIVVEECVYDRHEAAHALNLFDMNRKYADVLSLDEVTQWISKRE